MNAKNLKQLIIGLVLFVGGAIAAPSVLAQSAAGAAAAPGGQVSSAAQTGTNFDLQLQILVASNSGEAGKMPSALEGIARELRNNLQVSNIRLVATYQHRVENSGRLEVNGVGTSQLASPTSNPQYTPTFYNYTISPVKLIDGADERGLVQLGGFRFQLRVPVQLSAATSAGNSPPNTVYENLGIVTGITIPLGEPVVVGTLNVGRADETLVVVVTARRAALR